MFLGNCTWRANKDGIVAPIVHMWHPDPATMVPEVPFQGMSGLTRTFAWTSIPKPLGWLPIVLHVAIRILYAACWMTQAQPSGWNYSKMMMATGTRGGGPWKRTHLWKPLCSHCSHIPSHYLAPRSSFLGCGGVPRKCFSCLIPMETTSAWLIVGFGRF